MEDLNSNDSLSYIRQRLQDDTASSTNSIVDLNDDSNGNMPPSSQQLDMTTLYRRLISESGDDPDRDGLLSTPRNAYEAMQSLTMGYGQSLEEIFRSAYTCKRDSRMIIIHDIKMISICECHLLPIHGKVSIGYIPDKKNFPIDKLKKLVELFSRRLQTMKRLTEQIANAVNDGLQAFGVGVVIDARQSCKALADVGKIKTKSVSFLLLGIFGHNYNLRNEFFDAINFKIKV